MTTSAPARRTRTGVLAYLYSSFWVHRLVPLRIALPVLAALGRRRWRTDAAFRDGEIAYRSLIVHGTPREGQGPAIAEQATAERLVKREMEWRPWILAKSRATGMDHFEAAKAQGRGVIVTTAHTGPQGALGRALTLRGHELHIPAGDWLFTDQREGYQGRAARRMLETTKKIGMRMVHRGGTFDQFAELLGQGEVVYLPFDVPGTCQMSFLGKQSHITSGAAVLAMQTGALIVAGFARREGVRATVRIHPAFDPRDHADADALRQALAAVIEPVILEEAHTMSTVFTPYLWAEDWPTYFA